MAAPAIDTVVIVRPGDEVDAEQLFEQTLRKNRLGKIEQEANGDVLIMPPTGFESSHQNFQIDSQLQAWAKRDGRGTGFDSNALYLLPDGSKKSPDASWVRQDKILRLSLEERRQYAVSLVPDFVIELMSQSDRYKNAQTKMEDYRRNGVELGWLICPKRREVRIYRADTVEVLENPQRVVAGPPVSGFVLKMADIWKGLDF